MYDGIPCTLPYPGHTHVHEPMEYAPASMGTPLKNL